MRISKIHIQNFRKLKNCTLDFGEKRTILVGANNSGKTSCIQAIVRFLKDFKSLSTRDFTLSNWEALNKVADNWIKDEKSKPSLNDIIAYLPQMDVWIEVDKKESYLIKDLIPSLDWEGKIVGVRIVFAPTDVETLYADFKVAYTNAQSLREEKDGLEIYPKDLWDYLNRGKLNSEFRLRYYILDIKKEPDNNDDVQPLPNIEFDEGNPLKSIIKVDSIDAERDFSDPDTDNHVSKNTLSKQLQNYYEKHIKPKESQLEKEDIGLLSALQEANQTLDDNIGIAFKGRIEELKGINYPGFHDPSIEIHSYVDVKNSISHESAVQFALNDEEGGLTLPENYNGLGFQNLISMYFKLIQFRDEWLHEGRIVRTDGDEEYIEPIHLVFIEEPEAHLHAQAQQVFVRKAYEALCPSSKFKEDGPYKIQLVLSTHSNHIVHDVSLNDMRYFHREVSKEINIPLSKIVNLTNVFGDNEETERFVTRYIRLSQCDFFFADAVILVEGSGERILMPKFLGNEKMMTNYISIIEINGSHAHRFRKLVERLDIPCLIITDIDAQSKQKDGSFKKHFTQKGKGQKSNNDTLKLWVPGKTDVDELLDLNDENKVSGNVRVAYQTGVNAKLKDGVEDLAYPYTFEDALALSNIELFKKEELKGLALITNFKDIIAKSDTVEKCCEDMFETLTPAKKAPFAINLLYLKQFDKIETPTYIKEGLAWLKYKLNTKN